MTGQEVPAPATYERLIEELGRIPMEEAGRRREFLAHLPREFWLWLQGEEFTIGQAAIRLGVCRDTVRAYFVEHKMAWDQGTASTETRINTLAFANFMAGIKMGGEPHKMPVVDPDKTWLVICDLHSPTLSEIWTRRAIEKAEEEKVDGTLVEGDLMNQDAVSKFAIRDRGKMPTLQYEIDRTRPLVKLLLSLGPVKGLLTNHDRRAAYKLGSEQGAADYFKSIFHGGEWFEFSMMAIGEKPLPLLVHDKSRKWAFTLAADYSLANEREVWLAHTHRAFTGMSPANRRIGGLGGLFDRDRMGYYITKPSLMHWQNGFAIWKNRRMRLYTEEDYA